MSDVTWLTQQAHDRLVEELAEREGPTRVEITKRIEAAREEGDLKENGGYHAAKEEQGKNEARIRQLKQLLESAQIGAPDAADDEEGNELDGRGSSATRTAAECPAASAATEAAATRLMGAPTVRPRSRR